MRFIKEWEGQRGHAIWLHLHKQTGNVMNWILLQTCAWFWQTLRPKVGRSHWTNYLRGPVIKHKPYLQWASGYKYFHHLHILMTGPFLMLTAGLAPPDLHSMKNWVPWNIVVYILCSRRLYMKCITSVIISGSMWRLVLEGPRLTSIWTSPVKKDNEGSWESESFSLGARHSTFLPATLWTIKKESSCCIYNQSYPENL